MAVREASADETPYGRYIGSDGWFVLNLADALAVRNEEKGGATYPLESRDHPFADVGVRVCVLWPGDPNAVYHSDRKSTRLNSSHMPKSRMPSSA